MQHIWKKIIKKAWYHDRNFCNCMPIDLGLGMIPIVSIIPMIGSLVAYAMHTNIVKLASKAGAPKKVQAKMYGNMLTDFLISLVPLLGVLFCWLNGCSTRNAAIFDTWLRKQTVAQLATAGHPQAQGQPVGQPISQPMGQPMGGPYGQPAYGSSYGSSYASQASQPASYGSQTSHGSHANFGGQPAYADPPASYGPPRAANGYVEKAPASHAPYGWSHHQEYPPQYPPQTVSYRRT